MPTPSVRDPIELFILHRIFFVIAYIIEDQRKIILFLLFFSHKRQTCGRNCFKVFRHFHKFSLTPVSNILIIASLGLILKSIREWDTLRNRFHEKRLYSINCQRLYHRRDVRSSPSDGAIEKAMGIGTQHHRLAGALLTTCGADGWIVGGYFNRRKTHPIVSFYLSSLRVFL